MSGINVKSRCSFSFELKDLLQNIPIEIESEANYLIEIEEREVKKTILIEND